MIRGELCDLRVGVGCVGFEGCRFAKALSETVSVHSHILKKTFSSKFQTEVQDVDKHFWVMICVMTVSEVGYARRFQQMEFGR